MERSAAAPVSAVKSDMARQLRHVGLEGFGGRRLDEAELRDRQCLEVVLQATALLAHCQVGGFRLAGGWDEARVSSGALLKIPGVRPGRFEELPQLALRRLLLRLFKSDDMIQGRGQARRVARHLCARWQQTLAPVSCDREVGEILDAAHFLWRPASAAARTALVAEHLNGGRRELWVVGPGASRRRLLGSGADRPAIEAVLKGSRALDLWEGWEAGGDPGRLAREGSWPEALAIWRREPPQDSEAVEIYAAGLFRMGRYAAASAVLEAETSFSARVRRVWCQLLLGDRNAARMAVRRLATRQLTVPQTCDLGEIAIRLHGDRRQRAKIRAWIRRMLSGATGRSLVRARILAALGAWDLGEGQAMDEYLEAGRAALEDPELAWRWHHARALRAMSAGDALRAVEHVEKAFRLARKDLSRGEAGRLWNDVAVARAYADDLPGAERACLHSLRLLSGCEGRSSVSLAQHNLAELRLRRGRTAGVESTLEMAAAENRRNDNIRAQVRGHELWIRWELVQGRAMAALARCNEIERQIADRYVGDRQATFDILAARGLGWLERPVEARSRLERATRDGNGALLELEPEERPAVWALAGDMEKALAEAAGTPWAGIWTAFAADTLPRRETWDQLKTLEGYRAARLIFDCELVRTGSVPPSWIREAIVVLRRVGAEMLAAQLENRSQSPWKAIETYLEPSEVDARSTSELLAAAGYGNVELAWRARGGEEIVIAGRGGESELVADLESGSWVLRSTVVDRVLRALFALITRHLTPPRTEPAERPSRPTLGIIGKSDALRRALDRVEQLGAGELPILVLGESGTGKELFAREIHRASRRASRPCLPINCATLSETLIQSDLFGHVRGAFTGADRDRAGVFESARGGTVFLDEIGDLPAAVQGQLLRVLQEGEIRRVGESFNRKVDVRIVAATHRDLGKMVETGDFRQDLFFRLRGATIELPALRERGQDVLLLANHFLDSIGEAAPHPVLMEDAREKLLTYPWPGNVRELRNVLEVAATLADGGEIRSEHLELNEDDGDGRSDYHRQVDAFRKHLVRGALAATGNNRSEAARRLGLTRQALSYLVRQLNLS